MGTSVFTLAFRKRVSLKTMFVVTSNDSRVVCAASLALVLRLARLRYVSLALGLLGLIALAPETQALLRCDERVKALE
jgi:hypothetical protein